MSIRINVLFMLGCTVAAMFLAASSADIVNWGGFSEVWHFLSSITAMPWDLAWLQLLFGAAIDTIAIAVVCTAIGMGAALIGALLSSYSWWQAFMPRFPIITYWCPTLFRLFLLPLRAVHELIWALIFVVIIGLNPMAAIVAIVIPMMAMSAKVIADICDDADQTMYQQLCDRGVNPCIAWWYTIAPSAVTEVFSYSFYRFECALRAAAVLGIVGTGGLGQEIFLSIQGRQYGEVWSGLVALVGVIGCAELLSSWVRLRIRQGQSVHFWRWCAGGLVAIIGAALWWLPLEFSRLLPHNMVQRTAFIGERAWPFDFTGASPSAWVEMSSITLAMSWLGMVMAVLVGAAVTIFQATRMVSERKPHWSMQAMSLGVRLLLLVMRAVPAPLWALLVCFVFFPGIIPGAIALGLYTAGILGRLYGEAVTNAPRDHVHMLTQTGAKPMAVFMYSSLPTCWPQFLSYTVYRGEETVRLSVAIGLVAAGGLGQWLHQQRTSLDFAGMAATLMVYVLLVAIVDVVGYSIRRAGKARRFIMPS